MKKIGFCGLLIACMLCICGCTVMNEEKIKLRDLDFTVLGQEMIPEQLLPIIEEKRAVPFQITYTDNANLYICIGYGEQETGGYSIAVNALYETTNAVYVDTNLIGPARGYPSGNPCALRRISPPSGVTRKAPVDSGVMCPITSMQPNAMIRSRCASGTVKSSS